MLQMHITHVDDDLPTEKHGGKHKIEELFWQ